MGVASCPYGLAHSQTLIHFSEAHHVSLRCIVSNCLVLYVVVGHLNCLY